MWPESLTWARATASSHRTGCRPCRRRRARAERTTTGVARAVAAFAHHASMITAPGSHLAAEYPIGPRRVTENQRYQHGHADQHEELAALRRRRLPDGDALRHDIGIHADAKSGIGQQEQRQGQEERLVIPFVGERPQ